jgi:hypothetical protein
VAYSREHYLANKEQYAAKSKAWREANPERAKANRRRSYLENKAENKTYSTTYKRKQKYGVDDAEYQRLLAKQNKLCAICAKTCTRQLAVDHDHVTGRVRGLLCNSCNRGLGYFKDSQVLLGNARDYLIESVLEEICGV